MPVASDLTVTRCVPHTTLVHFLYRTDGMNKPHCGVTMMGLLLKFLVHRSRWRNSLCRVMQDSGSLGFGGAAIAEDRFQSSGRRGIIRSVRNAMFFPLRCTRMIAHLHFSNLSAQRCRDCI